MRNDPDQLILPGLDRSEPKEPPRELTGDELRDIGMKRALDHAGDDWRDRALEIVWIAARRSPYVHSDDLHRLAGDLKLPPPPDKRSWGGIMRKAKINGWISKTGKERKSTRAVCHSQPKPIYRSHIYDQPRTP